jgi:hypothetical protein
MKLPSWRVTVVGRAETNVHDQADCAPRRAGGKTWNHRASGLDACQLDVHTPKLPM